MGKDENYAIFFGEQAKGSLSLDPRRAKLAEWLHKYAPPQGGKALDIGCWNGDFLNMLPPSWDRWGLDIERHPDLPPEIHFQTANVEEPFPPDIKDFDLVFAGEIIEHVLETQIFLERCYQVLNPGGIFILTTPNLACWLNLWQWYRLGQFWCVNSDAGQDGHVRYLAPLTLRDSLTRAGFTIAEMASSGGLEFLRRLPRVYQLSARLFPMRGKNILVAARKPHPKAGEEANPHKGGTHSARPLNKWGINGR